MAQLVLALYAAFVLVALPGRAWLQYRRTGDHGLRFSAAGRSRVEVLAAGLIAVACLCLLAAPLSVLAGFLPRPRLPVAATILGLGAATAGFVLTVVAQLEMGSSWRVGVDPREPTPLVTRGLFSRVRNPIFSSAGLFAAGCALLVPNGFAAAGLLCGVLGLELQVRCVEEPILRRLHGEAYERYLASVGRFVPRLGRLSKHPSSDRRG